MTKVMGYVAILGRDFFESRPENNTVEGLNIFIFFPNFG